MAELTKEIFESLPEAVQGDYELNGEVYIPRAEGKAAKLKQTLNDLDGKLKGTEAELNEFRTKREQDRIDAENAALEKLKKEGKTEEILADNKRRIDETKAQYEERIKNLTNMLRADKKEAALAKLSKQLGIKNDALDMFNRVYGDRIDVDPETGRETILDANGGATGLDLNGLAADLEKDKALNYIRDANVGKPGLADGSNQGGGAPKSLSDMTATEEAVFANKNPELYQQMTKGA